MHVVPARGEALQTMNGVRDSGESDEQYARRRGREAAKLESQCGAWQNKAAEKTILWHEHLNRAGSSSWPGSLLGCRNRGWLQIRRAVVNYASVFGGRLGLRSSPARPHLRFEDGVAHAKTVV